MMTQIEQSFFEAATKYFREHLTNPCDINDIKIVDWEQRRYEIAKDAMNALVSRNIHHSSREAEDAYYSNVIRASVMLADDLIYELKKKQ